jgi:hypothetical protein
MYGSCEVKLVKRRLRIDKLISCFVSDDRFELKVENWEFRSEKLVVSDD